MAVFITSCSPFRGLEKALDKQINDSDVFQQSFTGLAVYDPETEEFIYKHNADKYFTPASNTKLFTYYAGLKVLGDSIPALKYTLKDDSLIFWGTGDPSLLNPDLSDSSIYQFLSERKEKLYYAPPGYLEKFFGPGWAWDDYNDYYSVERSAFPIYGNYISIELPKNDSIPIVRPPYFKQFLNLSADTSQTSSDLVRRDISENVFRFKLNKDTARYEQQVPFRYSPELFAHLLSDTLKKEVRVIDQAMDKNNAIIYFYGIPADSLYKRMLQVSDNFIAEQILMMCAGMISDTLKTDIAIDFVMEYYLDDLSDKPVWVDGSGLSRYNLFTPRSLVKLLMKIWDEVPQEKLFRLMPAGGKSGTLENWYSAEEPYIFAKTGSLSNNHNLSGYIKTKSGKVLIFSFMNNNYTVPTSSIKTEMEKVLRDIYLQY